MLGKLHNCMQINETRIHPHTMHKNKFKMAQRLKHKTRHHKTPGREHRQNILWHQSYKYFLRSVSQVNRNKNKNKQMEPNQTYKTLQSKGNNWKMKRQLTEWEKIIENDATKKGLILKIQQKKTHKIQQQKKKQPNWKMGRRPKYTFH